MPFKAILYIYRYCYYFIIGRDGEGGKREEDVQSSTRANQMMMKREVTTARDMKLMSGRGRGRWERGCEVRGSILYCDYYSH